MKIKLTRDEAVLAMSGIVAMHQRIENTGGGFEPKDAQKKLKALKKLYEKFKVSYFKKD